MGKPLNWVLSGAVPARKAASRALRHRLAATTILAVVPFLGYGRQAYADCVPVTPTAPDFFTHICSGPSGAQTITFADANVGTAANPAFVNTGGLVIEGTGHIRFTDENQSTITNNDGTGLRVTSEFSLGIGGVTIATDGAISGTNHGIAAYNEYSEDGGSLSITVAGDVTGVDGNENPELDALIPNDGIHARNYGDDLSITTTAGSTVSGEHNAIDARNLGSGDLTIDADGVLASQENDGVFAANHGRNLYITLGASSSVDGAGNGVNARNFGAGALDIRAYGYVLGNSADGIRALNVNSGEYYDPYFPSGGQVISGSGVDLRITTGVQSTVYGYDNGIDARNLGSGSGNLEITADGDVTGFGNDGIYAVNEGNSLTITTGPASVVLGAGHGIGAENRGTGGLTIEANGFVAGSGIEYVEPEWEGEGYTKYTGDGIHAFNSWNSDGHLTITTGPVSIVQGVDDGVDAEQRGGGNLVITAGGLVTGLGLGPHAMCDDYESECSEEEEHDGGYGIEGRQDTGNTYEDGTWITVDSTGLVQGDKAGIGVFTYGHDMWIGNYGTVRNLSGESHDLAIVTDGYDWGDTHVYNEGDLIGNVEFDAFGGKDTLENLGFWNMAGGTSDFGDHGYYGEDMVFNYGVLVAADDSSSPEFSRIVRLELFYNLGGVISLTDGQAGDVLLLTDQTLENSEDGAGNLFYGGEDAQLWVDAVLGPAPNGVSDVLAIDGSAWGETIVKVNVVGATGANFDGIPVVALVSEFGDTEDDAFRLDGPVPGGFFLWDMRYDGDQKWFELYTLTTNPDGSGDPILGPGAAEFPAGFGATRDIWLQTMNSVLNRQADLRPLLQGEGEGMNVTPVAEYSEPVEPTPLAPGATMSPGFWFKGFAAYVERDDAAGGFDISQKQTTYGGMAGLDFGTKEAFGDAMLFGVFGGYVGSDLKFASGSRWDYEGPTAGAYATYLDQAFYADLTVKADFLDIEIDPDDLPMGADDSDTDAVNVGGRLDTGYKFGGAVFLEPQASLAVVHTEIDDVEVLGGTVEFADDTSVLGRLGLRLGLDHEQADYTVYSADVTASVWEYFTGGDSAASISVPGFTDLGVSDDPASTYGDVSLGLSAAHPDGWSSFLRANYLFAEDYEAVTGNAGVRFVW